MRLDLPSFDEFYRAVHGFDPFPWQTRLASLVDRTGLWPAEIGVPTGLGKTSCLHVAVWALAVDSVLIPSERRAPTRIWWIVNRRLLVDVATAQAERLADLLNDALADEASELPVRAIAQALAARSPDGVPLQVVRLRGGAAIGRPTDPAQPALVLSTIPMYGSRLLFGGYGSSTSMRPIDAALAGTDSLVLVDEAHLARHLVDLFLPLGECDPAPEHPLPVARRRPLVVSLTATGAIGEADRFDLDAADLAHPTVEQRVHAAKPTRVERSTGPIDRKLAEAAIALLSGADAEGPGRSCVVFANTPATARKVFQRLAESLTKARPDIDADVELLTGRVREREAAIVRDRILTACATGAPNPVRNVVVIATQTLEVGADLDFDLLVTEACGVRALTQRLGRLNRLGSKPKARAVYCHVDAPKGEWPVYGQEPAEVLARLSQALNSDAVVDLGPLQIGVVLGPPGDDTGCAPAVLPALLWEWAKTTTPPPGSAPVEPYFSGLQPRDITVSVVWRGYVPSNGSPIWPPVREDESVDIPLAEAREALGDEEIVRLAGDRYATATVPAADLRPGDIVILSTEAGHYDRFGWLADRGDSAPVADLSLARAGLPLDPVALKRLLGSSAPGQALVSAALWPADEATDDDLAAARQLLIEAVRDAEPIAIAPDDWAELVAGLDPNPVTPVDEVPRLLRRGPSLPVVRVDRLDEMSLAAVVELEAHGAAVGARAERVARLLGMDEGLVSVVAAASGFHDVGKADRRFQRWLDPLGRAGHAVAKSGRSPSHWRSDRIAAGWPEGGRHEELSRRLVAAWADAADPPRPLLIEHLVVSHHGHGRPFLLPADDLTGGVVEFNLGGTPVSTCADLSAADWTQPSRFRALCESHGYWGLALLEAIVRQADHQVSAGNLGRAMEVI